MGLQRDTITTAAAAKTRHLLLHPSSPILERRKRIKTSDSRHWSASLLCRRTRPQKKEATSSPSEVVADLVEEEEEEEEEEEGESEAEEIEVRVKALQRMVPGGDGLGLERLFEETADYIEALQGQVSVMKSLVGLLDGLERKKRMMGG